MIKEIRDKEPFIHFGFNRQTIETHIGMPVTLWQDKLYKPDEIIKVDVEVQNAIAREEGINKYVLEFNALGTKVCKFITLTGESKNLQSNEVVVEVVPITWESKDIFFNNENITFNSL